MRGLTLRNFSGDSVRASRRGHISTLSYQHAVIFSACCHISIHCHIILAKAPIAYGDQNTRSTRCAPQ